MAEIMTEEIEQQRTLANQTRISATLHSQILEGLRSLYESQFYALCALKLKNINGAEGYGVDFSSAFCSTNVVPPYYPFGSIFGHGMRILHSFLQKPNEPLSEDNIKMCTKLMNFLTDTDSIDFMQNLMENYKKDLDNETGISVELAEHLLKKLAFKDNYLLDSGDRRTEKCRCGQKHDVDDKFKDTSIGNVNVWHGNIDILIGQDVPVFVLDTENNNPDEVNSKKSCGIKDQLIAETIVFSFYQKKRHPDATNSLIPAIGVSQSDVIFYFYDAELDVLLQSAHMPLSGQFISYGTLIAIWLVLNYRYLGSGLVGSLRETPKANFFSLSSKMIDVYRNHLSFGNVGYSYGRKAFHPSQVRVSNFVFPSGVERLDLS